MLAKFNDDGIRNSVIIDRIWQELRSFVRHVMQYTRLYSARSTV